MHQKKPHPHRRREPARRLERTAGEAEAPQEAPRSSGEPVPVAAARRPTAIQQATVKRPSGGGGSPSKMKLREMNDWKISNDTLKLGVELGRGSFGIVMAAEWRHTPVALKILFADAQADDKVLFEKEVRMMATLHHPNIVQFLGYARTPALTLVIELFPEGSVGRFVPERSRARKPHYGSASTWL